MNFDDPETYHLYYGDGVGHPGTIMTFFPWPGGTTGRQGTGQLTTTSFSVPESAMEFWVNRFRERYMSLRDLSGATSMNRYCRFPTLTVLVWKSSPMQRQATEEAGKRARFRLNTPSEDSTV